MIIDSSEKDEWEKGKTRMNPFQVLGVCRLFFGGSLDDDDDDDDDNPMILNKDVSNSIEID